MIITKSDFKIINQVNAVSPENTLFIVGSALNGPSRVPFQLNTIKSAKQILGDSPLADAYNTAFESGTPNIILYRLNGAHAEAIVKCVTSTVSKDVLLLRAVAGSDEYNGIPVTVYSTHIFLPATSTRQARSYFFDQYQTIQQLAYDINKDAHYGVIEFTVEVLDPGFDLTEFSDLIGDIQIQFDGGITGSDYIPDRSVISDELLQDLSVRTKAELKTALFGEDEQDQLEYIPNSMIGVLDFGVIVLVDIFHEDDPEFAEILGNFCKTKQVETGSGCIGVIGTRPLMTKDKTLNRETLIGLSPLEEEDWRKYVQVVVGDGYTFGNPNRLSLAYAYAASQAQYPYHVIMSNKTLGGIRKLEYEFSKEDVDSLSSNGYTCIVASIRKGFVPYVAVSYSRDMKALLSKPHCVRVVNYVSRNLTNRLDSFIGSKSNPITRQEVMDRVHEILGGLVDNKVIMEYKANGKFLNGNRDIDLQIDIRPFSEVRSVSSIVTLSVPGGVIR